ncbi:11236_t:CDS:2 [Dentiscutata heterogama]|uniref:11236_t:CDS:1 n=1 Tax=Dentiscutata heterogama TaxID=1316150 RepID=A0ACA9JY11_9GLOM|nr:11236_t:CDS:2 [Dentiscutata heterogama]
MSLCETNGKINGKSDSDIKEKPYSPFKSWIRIDLEEIIFLPKNEYISTKRCKHIDFMFKWTDRVIIIGFNASNFIEEVQIPLNQIVGIKITNKNFLEISLRSNFSKHFYRRIIGENGKITSSAIHNDPTSGRLKDPTTLVLIPCQKVHPSTLTFINIGIQKFHLNKSSTIRKNANDKYLVEEISNPIYEQDEQDSENDMLHITFQLLTHSRALLVPFTISLADLFLRIQYRFMIIIESFEYKNIFDDFITVECEEDWKIAKIDRDVVDKLKIIIRISSR